MYTGVGGFMSKKTKTEIKHFENGLLPKLRLNASPADKNFIKESLRKAKEASPKVEETSRKSVFNTIKNSKDLESIFRK